MSKKGRRELPLNRINTIIGKDTRLEGTLKAIGLVRIDGEMEGDLETEGDVIIGESGRVTLDLKARHVAIAGSFNGTIEAGGKLELRSTATLTGQIRTNGLIIDDGANFSGNCAMGRQDPAEPRKDAPAATPGNRPSK